MNRLSDQILYRHFEHKYFTIRERVALGEIALYWLSGKLNPADVTTKALDKAVTVAHSGVISGQAWCPHHQKPELFHQLRRGAPPVLKRTLRNRRDLIIRV